jgi:hypothetical protein
VGGAAVAFEHNAKPGEPICGSSLYRRFVSASKRAGPPRLRLHDLRHMFGTQAIRGSGSTRFSASWATVTSLDYAPDENAATAVLAVGGRRRGWRGRSLRRCVQSTCKRADAWSCGHSARTPKPAKSAQLGRGGRRERGRSPAARPSLRLIGRDVRRRGAAGSRSTDRRSPTTRPPARTHGISEDRNVTDGFRASRGST